MLNYVTLQAHQCPSISALKNGETRKCLYISTKHEVFIKLKISNRSFHPA